MEKYQRDTIGYTKQVTEEHGLCSLFCVKYILLYVNVYKENNLEV